MIELITPISYWILTVLWLIILGLYLVKLKAIRAAGGAVAILLIILAIDAFRTVFESVYFGFYFNSLFGLLPKGIHQVLSQPILLIIPKLINIFAGLLVLFLLIRRWVPQEIREREKTLEELQQSINSLKKKEATLNAIFEGTSDAIVLLTPEREITTMNHAGVEIFGYNIDEIVGKSSALFYESDEEFRSQGQIRFNQSAEKNTEHYEAKYKHKDGRVIVGETLGTVVKTLEGETLGYIAVVRDISERNKADAKLNLQVAAMNAADDAIIITDKTGLIQWVNPAYEKLTGYSFEESVGKNTKMLKSGRQNKAFYKNLWDTILSGKTWHGRLYNKAKDGRIYMEESSITPVLNKDSGIDHFIAIKRDITEQLKQEEQIRRSQKMDALGKLTGGIAHDFNNLLSVILGYSELLKNKLIDQPKLSNYADQIYHASERGAKLTKKLLAYTRQQPLEAKAVNINALLKQQQDLLQKTLTVRINLHLHLTDDIWPVWLDLGELEDAILNISINALHAMNEQSGDELTIRTSNQSLDKKEALSLGLKAGDYVQLSITDTGCGMDDSTKEKLFDPFFTTKDSKGTGLGLTQVFNFVKHSAGGIKVISNLNHGSQFVLYFPRYSGDNEDSFVPVLKNETVVGGNEKILVVDDEEALRFLAADILSRHGYNVIFAESGLEAIQILENERVDLVLTDIIMPEMDGYQLATFVKEKYPRVKIQLASGFFDTHHKDKVNNKLLKNMLHKPYNSKVLLKQIRTLLDSTSTSVPSIDID